MIRRTRGILAIVVAGALALTACGSGDSAPVETTAPTETAPTATDSPTDTTAPEGTSVRDTFVSIEGVPGVSDTEISFVSISIEANNPLGIDIRPSYNNGIRAYFNWRNDEGGLFGRHLVLAKEIDDEFINNQARALEVVGGKSAFGVFMATLIPSGAGALSEAGIPFYGWNISPTEYANRLNMFGHIGVGCVDCVGRTNPYVASQVGATKVATLGYGVSENSKVCTQGLQRSFNFYEPELGIKVVYFNDDLAFGLPNGIGPEVTAMKDAGVQYIATCMDLNGMKTLGYELKRQGMDVVMYHPNSYDPVFISESDGIFEGDWVVPQFLPFELKSDLEVQQKFFEYMKLEGAEPTELAMIGWINAHTAFESILLAGPQFDQQKAIDAMNAQTAYSAGGLSVPIDWTKQHIPTTSETRANGGAFECFSPVKVVDNRFVAVGTVDAPWLCWDNSTDKWAAPVAMSFGS